MDSSTEVSPYLKNPQPYVAPHESACQEIDNSGLQTTTSFSPEEIADVRAAVAELLVFGFHGTRLNNHARSLIAIGKCFLSIPPSVHVGFFCGHTTSALVPCGK